VLHRRLRRAGGGHAERLLPVPSGRGELDDLRARPLRNAMTGDPKKKPEEYDRPSPFSPFALVVIAILIVGGWFVIDWARKSSRIQDCVMSGRKNCAPIDDDR
jgi:hypothetical protein